MLSPRDGNFPTSLKFPASFVLIIIFVRIYLFRDLRLGDCVSALPFLKLYFNHQFHRFILNTGSVPYFTVCDLNDSMTDICFWMFVQPKILYFQIQIKVTVTVFAYGLIKVKSKSSTGAGYIFYLSSHVVCTARLEIENVLFMSSTFSCLPITVLSVPASYFYHFKKTALKR